MKSRLLLTLIVPTLLLSLVGPFVRPAAAATLPNQKSDCEKYGWTFVAKKTTGDPSNFNWCQVPNGNNLKNVKNQSGSVPQSACSSGLTMVTWSIIGQSPQYGCVNATEQSSGTTNPTINCPTGQVVVDGKCQPDANSSAAAQAYCTGKNYSGTDYTDCTTGYDNPNDTNACNASSVKNKSICQDAQTAGKNAASSTPSDSTAQCISNGSTTLEWLFCPLTSALGKATDGLNNFIQNQLDFSVDSFLPNGGTSSAAGAHVAWNIFKDLVSSVLIIILLVMVISQAIGSGLFEAYTVKKVLPRLVIAVILMQLSWDLCRYAVTIADDIGNGIKDLICAPFGGAGNLDLNSLLSHLGTFWAGAAQGGIAAALVTSTFLAVGNPAGALLVVFVLILAVIVALATILFRNVLIIACVIFSPVAILLWVLPGGTSQKYWKMWSSNFVKLLLLFPMITGMIYVGRIFAYIVAGQGSAGFIDFIMVLVGFFGPYFMIPRAFKWGGELLGAAAGGVTTLANKGGGERAKKWLGEQKEARKGLNEYNATRALAANNYRGITGAAQRRVHRLVTGTTGVTTANKIKFQRQILDKAEEFRNEDIGRATKRLVDQELPQYDRNSHDAIREAIITGRRLQDDTHNMALPPALRRDNRVLAADGRTRVDYDPHHFYDLSEEEYGVRAALDRGVIHSQFHAIESYMQHANRPGASAEERANAVRFLDANAGVMGEKMTHLLKGMNVAASSDPTTIAKMRGEEVESILSTLSQRVNDATLSAPDRQRAAEQMSTFLQNYSRAAADPIVGRSLNQSGARAMRAFTTSNAGMLATINTPRTNFGLQQVMPEAAVNANLNARLSAAQQADVVAALGNINAHINDQGVVS